MAKPKFRRPSHVAAWTATQAIATAVLLTVLSLAVDIQWIRFLSSIMLISTLMALGFRPANLLFVSFLFDFVISPESFGGISVRPWMIALALAILNDIMTSARKPQPQTGSVLVIGSTVMSTVFGVFTLSYVFSQDRNTEAFWSSVVALAFGVLVLSWFANWALVASRRELESLTITARWLGLYLVLFWSIGTLLGSFASRLEFPVQKPNLMALFFLVAFAMEIVTRPSLSRGLFMSVQSFGLFATGSRGAIVGLAALLLVLFIFWVAKRAPINLLQYGNLVLTIASGFFLLTLFSILRQALQGVEISFQGGDSLGLLNRELSGADGVSGNVRLSIWEEALVAIKTSGFLGVGPGNESAAFRSYGHSHNLFLSTFLELGIVPLALLIIALFLLQILVMNLFSIRASATIIATSAAVQAAYFFMSNWEFQLTWVLLGILVGRILRHFPEKNGGFGALPIILRFIYSGETFIRRNRNPL